MFNKKTTDMLQGLLPSLPVIIGESSLYHDIADITWQVAPKMSLAIVNDVNTYEACGNSIYYALNGKHKCVTIKLDDGVEATAESVEHIRRKTAKFDAIIAVGSGTINDICKYAAYLDNKPYIVFPTAASMNGYLSANASITVKGNKAALPAKLPIAVFCDFSVIASAPVRLNKSGLGDSLARPTAQADWLLSNMLLGTDYNEKPFELLVDIEQELFADAGGIAKNDLNSVRKLTKLLLLSGLGMTIAGGSYPASQGEHMIAHTYNMLKNSARKFKVLHGEEIGVTSLYMARLQDRLLCHYCEGGNLKLPIKKIPAFAGMTMDSLFGESLAEEFATQYAKKQMLTGKIQQINWYDVQEKIEPIMLKPAQMEKIIEQANLPPDPEAIGWNANDFATACATARFTRNRFTFLDIK